MRYLINRIPTEYREEVKEFVWYILVMFIASGVLAILVVIAWLISI